VTDVPAYPQFLPWCDHARVLTEQPGGMTAEVGIAFSGVRQNFTTRNPHVPGRERSRCSWWTARSPGWTGTGTLKRWATAQRACRVDLKLHYGFDNATLGGWSGRCSTASPPAWWMPLSSGPSRSMAEGVLNLLVVYSPAAREVVERPVELPQPATVAQALAASGLLQAFGLDAARLRLGIWGRKATLEQPVRDMDRIEIYRPLTVDPKVARRERFAKQGSRTTGLFARRRPGGKAGY
jgi:putative ubiquitin-RnfH superfamily antitoxin RatB of RatAB toxin-antitoxin module/ribosome-associated toxin RatA of RatAB toxin-antitoxin module